MDYRLWLFILILNVIGSFNIRSKKMIYKALASINIAFSLSIIIAFMVYLP